MDHLCNISNSVADFAKASHEDLGKLAQLSSLRACTGNWALPCEHEDKTLGIKITTAFHKWALSSSVGHKAAAACTHQVSGCIRKLPETEPLVQAWDDLQKEMQSQVKTEDVLLLDDIFVSVTCCDCCPFQLRCLVRDVVVKTLDVFYKR